ncbi:MAG: hypothetical protein Kow0031_35890 [Anaerolineae bacterium]
MCVVAMPNHPENRNIQALRFNVSQLLKETTGAKRHHPIETTALAQQLDDVKLVAPLVGGVDFLRTGRDILVTGRFDTTVEKSCGRCLATFSTPIIVELEEIFFPTIDLASGNPLEAPEDADEANRIDELHTLDLTEVVRQAVTLEAEGARYCKADCKGLCPHCGQDRNVQNCTCADEIVDMRWAGLLSLQTEE